MPVSLTGVLYTQALVYNTWSYYEVVRVLVMMPGFGKYRPRAYVWGGGGEGKGGLGISKGEREEKLKGKGKERDLVSVCPSQTF